MKSGIRQAAFIVSCFALTGCAANDLMLKRQAETESRVELLIQSSKSDSLRTNELVGQLQALEDKNRTAAEQISQLQNTIRELRASQDELKARVILLVQQTPPPKIEVVNQDPASRAREAALPAEYVRAFGLYSANSFIDAVNAFETFIKNNPQSEFVANAYYWIGECHYSVSDLAKAKETFSRVSEKYPNSSKAPDALLKLGYTAAALKEKEKAHAIFEKLIKSYPSSAAAAKARERLTAN